VPGLVSWGASWSLQSRANVWVLVDGGFVVGVGCHSKAHARIRGLMPNLEEGTVGGRHWGDSDMRAHRCRWLVP
jgi:hypothetical protein